MFQLCLNFLNLDTIEICFNNCLLLKQKSEILPLHIWFPLCWKHAQRPEDPETTKQMNAEKRHRAYRPQWLTKPRRLRGTGKRQAWGSDGAVSLKGPFHVRF